MRSNKLSYTRSQGDWTLRYIIKEHGNHGKHNSVRKVEILTFSTGAATRACDAVPEQADRDSDSLPN